jgi:hypothetical protein
MSHHNDYETVILRLANQPSDLLDSSSPGFFTAKIPGHLRDKECYIHVISGSVSNLNNIFEGTEDANIVLLRHNITTLSYDITSKGTDKFFGDCIRPANSEKVAKLNEDVSKDLGLCILPPQIEVETVGFLTATGQYVRLDKAAHYVEFVLRLDFPK